MVPIRNVSAFCPTSTSYLHSRDEMYQRRFNVLFEMGERQWMRKEMEQIHASHPAPPAHKKQYTIYDPDWVKLLEFEWVWLIQGDHFSTTCVLSPAKIS